MQTLKYMAAENKSPIIMTTLTKATCGPNHIGHTSPSSSM